MATIHPKRGGSRAALPRRTTRGPLDGDDPLSTPNSIPPSPRTGLSASPALSADADSTGAALLSISQVESEPDQSLLDDQVKDLSFLLDPSLYHSISNIDTPTPFRQPLRPPPAAHTPLGQISIELKELLKRCEFIAAADLAAIALTSGFVQPTDIGSISYLLSVRYSALELSGNIVLAAQESRALEDLSSTFYYDEVQVPKDTVHQSQSEKSLSKHIMPFDLRLQALRLQGIGFGDPRRAIAALYDMGMECRTHMVHRDAQDQSLWETRLEEVGIRVVNSLVEMGDFDCAKRTLQSMCLDHRSNSPIWTARLFLLMMKMGDVDEARRLLAEAASPDVDRIILKSFIEIADGNYDGARKLLSEGLTTSVDQSLYSVAKQNLAVAYLYTGEIEKSCEILEELVEAGMSFQALTMNLATLYELTSDKSSDRKAALAAKIARIRPATGPQRGFINADFKL